MTAFVDLLTGKIVGAKKGTITYFHEEGHVVYNKSDKGMRNAYREQSYFLVTVVFLVIAVLSNGIYIKTAALCSCTIFLYFHFYEEAWCWKYAIRKMKSKEKDIRI